MGPRPPAGALVHGSAGAGSTATATPGSPPMLEALHLEGDSPGLLGLGPGAGVGGRLRAAPDSAGALTPPSGGGGGGGARAGGAGGVTATNTASSPTAKTQAMAVDVSPVQQMVLDEQEPVREGQQQGQGQGQQVVAQQPQQQQQQQQREPQAERGQGQGQQAAQGKQEQQQGQQQAGQGLLCYERVAPALLPEPHLTLQVAVRGPRYWPQHLDWSCRSAAGADGTAAAAAASAAPPSSSAPGAVAANALSTPLPGGLAASAPPPPPPPGQWTPAPAPLSSTPLPQPRGNGVGGAVSGIVGPPGSQAAASAAAAGAASAAVTPFPVHGYGAASALDTVYRQLVLFVKKRAGSLSYSQDPSGIRSLLSRAFHGHGLLPAAAALRHSGEDDGSDSDGDSGYTAQEGQGDTAAGAGGEGEGEGGTGSGSSCFDLVHLCATFSVDPSIMAFAQHIKAMRDLWVARGEAEGPGGGVPGTGGGAAACGGMRARLALLAPATGLPGKRRRHDDARGGSSSSSLGRRGADLLTFCYSVLYECITGEKTVALLPYLQLYCLVASYVRGDGCSGPSAAEPTRRRRVSGDVGCRVAVAAAAAAHPAALLTAPGVPPAVALQGLQLAREYYGGSLAAAAATVATAAAQAPGGGGGLLSDPDEQALWRPLLQHAFLEGLWCTLQLRCWRPLGLLQPAGGGGSGSALAAYLRLGRMPRPEEVPDAARSGEWPF